MRTLITAALLLIALPVYAEDVKDEASPRLKFKKGPVCMCSEGLTEKDIRASLKQQKEADKSSTEEKIQQTEASRKGDEEDK